MTLSKSSGVHGPYRSSYEEWSLPRVTEYLASASPTNQGSPKRKEFSGRNLLCCLFLSLEFCLLYLEILRETQDSVQASSSDWERLKATRSEAELKA